MKDVQFAMVSFKLVIILTAVGTWGDLLPQDVSDGPCLSFSELLPKLHKVNTIPVLVPGDYYVPMGSKALYRQYALGLLGRPAIDQLELDSMQLFFRCGVLLSTITNLGFPSMDIPPRFGQYCLSGALPDFSNLGIFSGSFNINYVQAVCVGLPAIYPNTTVALRASPSFAATMDSIVWANDDSSILLTYRCPYDGIKDFKVVAKNKTLREEDIFTITEKVLALGFSEANIAFMQYDE